MLIEFRVDNFKSLINGVFTPQGMNLLLGTNNSGKTNLCQALKFMSGSAAAPLDRCADEAARGRFGLTNFALDKSTIDFYLRAHIRFRDEELVFEYVLTISPPRPGVVEAAVKLEHETLIVSGWKFNERTVLLENTAGRIRLLDEKSLAASVLESNTSSVAGAGTYRETTAPTDATMLQRLFDEESNPRISCFRKYLASWTYYDLSPAAMRGSGYKPGTFVLDPEGSNLAYMLFMLKTGRERDYRKLLEIIRQVEPSIDLINFMGGSEENVFMFFEDAAGHALSGINASNGTLRFLAMAYVLLIQPKIRLSPLCIIEEPENGIYVGLLKTLLGMIDRSPGSPQLIFTSHAPYFIDIFDDNLDGLFLLNRRQGHTAITQPDIDRVKARLERFPLGEQHFREML